MKLQNYKDGEIHRKGDNYYFKKDGEMIGPYGSAQEIVDSQNVEPPKDKKWDKVKEDTPVFYLEKVKAADFVVEGQVEES